MQRFIRFFQFTLVMLIVMSATGVHAQWSNDPTVNTPLCTANLGQFLTVNSSSNNKLNVYANVPDGAGGMIITWQDLRNGLDWNIYAQRLDADGNPHESSN